VKYHNNSFKPLKISKKMTGPSVQREVWTPPTEAKTLEQYLLEKGYKDLADTFHIDNITNLDETAFLIKEFANSQTIRGRPIKEFIIIPYVELVDEKILRARGFNPSNSYKIYVKR